MNIYGIILIDLIAFYILIGLICSIVASHTSGKDTMYEKEIILLTKIIVMWSWKYKVLFNQLKDERQR